MVTVCIVNYNGRHHLEKCFNSIKECSYPVDKTEVILVDNASSDGSVEYVRTNYQQVKVLALDRNFGFAKANNIGAKNANGEYVVFLNNDTVVTPDWLDPLVDVMKAYRDIGAAGSKILFMEKPHRINSAGGNIPFFGGGYDVGFMENDSERFNVRGSRGYVCAACMMVRKEEFLDIGGFDADYFMYSEDSDLCWRYWLFGKKVEYVPESTIYHKYGGTSGIERDVPIRMFYGARNGLFNIVKNYQLHNVFIAFFLSIPFHFIKMLSHILKLEFRSALLIIKAYVSFFTNLPKLIKKRMEIQAKRKVKDSYLFSNSVIVSFTSAFKEFIRLYRLKNTGSCSPDGW